MLFPPMKRMALRAFIFMTIFGLSHAAPNRSRRQSRRHNHNNDDDIDDNIKSSLSELESKLNTKVHAIEHKLSWKINDKIRRVNQTVEIAHLEHVLHRVHEELADSVAQGQGQKAEISNLQEVITAQNSELTVVRTKLQALEDIVLNLTSRIELSAPTAAAAAESNEDERKQTGDLTNHIRPPHYNSNYPKGLYSDFRFLICC